MLALALCGPAASQTAAPPAPASTGIGASLLARIVDLTGPGMDGRGAGSEGGAKARAYIEAALAKTTLAPAGVERYAQPFTTTTRAGTRVSGVNLLARCPGRRADAPTIVVSAHYDHLGVRDGKVYPGADDNASGVALLLHIAERCAAQPFTHPLLLAFFDAEELGLQGAKAFVQAPTVPIDRIAVNLNFDMVSRSDTRELYVSGPGRWPRLKDLLAPVAANAPINVRFGHDTGGGQDDWTTQSDHGAFHAAGIPFVYLGVEDHADYHKPTDTPEKIAPAFLDGVAAVALRVLTALDGATAFK
ncbi:MAG: M28 family peptidase [Vicinamibacterales bacterium]